MSILRCSRAAAAVSRARSASRVDSRSSSRRTSVRVIFRAASGDARLELERRGVEPDDLDVECGDALDERRLLGARLRDPPHLGLCKIARVLQAREDLAQAPLGVALLALVGHDRR